jgi:cyclopropane-fatty-acyl-phospholipid synthase
MIMSGILPPSTQHWLLTYCYDAARQLVCNGLDSCSKGTLKILSNDGLLIKSFGECDAASAVLTVRNQYFWIRVLLFGDIGFSQSYMLNEITTSNLTAVFEFFIRNTEQMNTATYSRITSTLRNMFLHLTKRANRIATSKSNVDAHYSLSNEIFAAFLSPDMTYSAPLWLPTSHPLAKSQTLEDAQLRKLQYAISTARIKSTDHVLEIGTGWGSFAIEAAKTTGCRVTTVTPSAVQKDLANRRIADAGLTDRVQVVLADYRELDIGERYDKIVSIEMIEHVGHDFLATYFECMDRYLKFEGGVAYFQCITIPETRYAEYLRSEDFIKRYIFPGGNLPTVSGLVAAIERGSRGKLIVEEVKSFGGHYVKALRLWKERFLGNFDAVIMPSLKKMYPDMAREDVEVFKRKWEVSEHVWRLWGC